MKKRIIGLLVGAMLIGSVSPVYASELTNQVEDTVESSQVDSDDSENIDSLYTGYKEFQTPKTMYIKNGWGRKVYKDVNGTDGKLVKASKYKDGTKVSVIGQGVYGQIMYYLFSGSNGNKYMVAKAGLQSNKPVVIKKYKKSKKLYVKKATKAYKVTSTGKLKVAKSLKKSAKVTVVGTATVKKVKYYAIKSGKSTMLVKQSLLSKTKPKTAKPSSKPSTNSSNSNSTASHPQNNTPSGYTKPKNDTSTKTDKNGNSIPTNIKSVKIVNGKVEYRDVDGTIKYAKYRAEKCNGYVYYDYWYNYREDGMWVPISMTDLTKYPEWAIDSIYDEQHIVWS